MASDQGLKPQSRQERRQQERDRARAESQPAASGRREEDCKNQKAQVRAAARGRPIPKTKSAPISTSIRPGSSAPRLLSNRPPNSDSPNYLREMAAYFQAATISPSFFQPDPSVTAGATRQSGLAEIKGQIRSSMGSVVKLAQETVEHAEEAAKRYSDFMVQELDGQCIVVAAKATVSPVTGRQTPVIIRSKKLDLLPKVLEYERMAATLVKSWTMVLSNMDESALHVRSIRRDQGNRVADPTVARLELSYDRLNERIRAGIQGMHAVRQELLEFINAIRRGYGTSSGARAMREDDVKNFGVQGESVTE